ncbi:MAG: hypothetical protein DRP76_01875, partial [Candidatus Omnitrophota bacterium]
LYDESSQTFPEENLKLFREILKAVVWFRDNLTSEEIDLIDEIFGVNLNELKKHTFTIFINNVLFSQNPETGEWWLYDEVSRSFPEEKLTGFKELLSRVIYLRDEIKENNLAKAFNEAYGLEGTAEEIDFSHLTKEDLSFFGRILYDDEGKIKPEKDIDMLIEYLPYVASIIGAINQHILPSSLFLEWTRRRHFEISGLPSSLNSDLIDNFGRETMVRFSDALFTLSFYMKHFLREASRHHLDVEDFNAVYDLHSLSSDYKLRYPDYDLAAALFMIISDYPGDFAKEFSGVVAKEYMENIPYVRELMGILQTCEDLRAALRKFHNIRIPATDFNLNPRNFHRFKLKEVGNFLFKIADLAREGTYQDVESYKEMMLKVYHNWERIGRMLGRRIEFSPGRIGFEYRILGGQVTIFIHDGWGFKNIVNPYTVSQLAISFVAEGESLSEVARRYGTKEYALIADATQIVSITERKQRGGLDYQYRFTKQLKHIYLPNEKEFYQTAQVYDATAPKGWLVKEEIEDTYAGYTLSIKYDYSKFKIFTGRRRIPLYIPDRIITKIIVNGREYTYIEARNDLESVTRQGVCRGSYHQHITYYTPRGKSYEIERVIDLAAGNILEEIDKEDGVHTYNTYTSAFMQILGIASRSVKYDIYTGEELSVTTFDENKDFKFTPQGIRIVSHIKDKVVALDITQEKDFLNKLHREIRKNHRIWRETRFYYEDAFIAGFGAASHSEDFDLFTGLKISTSHFLEFNKFGGISFKINKLIKETAKIVIFDGKGKIEEVYEGEKVEYENGRIYAEKVNVYSYEEGYWKARRIASKVERFSWDSLTQSKKGLVYSRISFPQTLMDLTNYYGAYRVLEIEEIRPKVGMRLRMFVNLVNGEPVRFITPRHIIDVDFNSLDVEVASRKTNLAGEVIEETETLVDELGRPKGLEGREVKDAQGRILKAHLIKHLTNPNTGEEKYLIQRFPDGLVDVVLIYSKVLGEVIWQVNIDYNEEEIEAGTQTIAYRNGVRLGEVKHTETLRVGEAKLYKREYFAIGSWQEYEQDAYSGLLNNIRIYTKVNGVDRVYYVHRQYDELDIVESWIMHLEGNRSLWVLRANRQRIDRDNKEIYFEFTWSGAHTETAVLDVGTGLFPRFIYDVEYEEGKFARWITEVEFDALGIEKSRNIYVDKDKNQEIDRDERRNWWVLKSERERIERSNYTVIHRYQKPNTAKGLMIINTQFGKEMGGTIEDVDMGEGLFEAFSYQIQFSLDLREIGRITRNSLGELVSKAWELEGAFNFEAQESTVYYITAWGEEGHMLIDTQSAFVSGYDFINIEVSPGIYDTWRIRIDYTERGTFKHSYKFSEALNMVMEEYFARDSTGLTQRYIDYTKDKKEMTYTYNVTGKLRFIESNLRKIENFYDKRGLLRGGIIEDKYTQERVIDFATEHEFTFRYGMQVSTLSINKENYWFNYLRGILDHTEVKYYNPYGTFLYGFIGEGSQQQKIEPVYDINGRIKIAEDVLFTRGVIESASWIYLKDESGEFSVPCRYLFDYQWIKGELNYNVEEFVEEILNDTYREFQDIEGRVYKQSEKGIDDKFMLSINYEGGTSRRRDLKIYHQDRLSPILTYTYQNNNLMRLKELDLSSAELNSIAYLEPDTWLLPIRITQLEGRYPIHWKEYSFITDNYFGRVPIAEDAYGNTKITTDYIFGSNILKQGYLVDRHHRLIEKYKANNVYYAEELLSSGELQYIKLKSGQLLRAVKLMPVEGVQRDIYYPTDDVLGRKFYEEFVNFEGKWKGFYRYKPESLTPQNSLLAFDSHLIWESQTLGEEKLININIEDKLKEMLPFSG